jgi:hypothetical protein
MAGGHVGGWQDRLGTSIFSPREPVLAGGLCVR